jgi:hypothetical protein
MAPLLSSVNLSVDQSVDCRSPAAALSLTQALSPEQLSAAHWQWLCCQLQLMDCIIDPEDNKGNKVALAQNPNRFCYTDSNPVSICKIGTVCFNGSIEAWPFLVLDKRNMSGQVGLPMMKQSGGLSIDAFHTNQLPILSWLDGNLQ